MESDMNSRRVIAGRQMTGDSGILSEVLIRVVYHCTFFIATLSGNRATLELSAIYCLTFCYITIHIGETSFSPL